MPLETESKSEVLRPSGDLYRSKDEVESTLSAPSDLYSESKVSKLPGVLGAGIDALKGICQGCMVISLTSKCTLSLLQAVLEPFGRSWMLTL